MRAMRDTERERFERIARRAADLVNAIYEFDFDPATIDGSLHLLDEVLAEAGYRPPYEKWEDVEFPNGSTVSFDRVDESDKLRGTE